MLPQSGQRSVPCCCFRWLLAVVPKVFQQVLAAQASLHARLCIMSARRGFVADIKTEHTTYNHAMCFVIIKGDISSLLLYSIRRNCLSHTHTQGEELHKGIDTRRKGSWEAESGSQIQKSGNRNSFISLKLCGWLSRKKKNQEFVRLFDITGILLRHCQFSSRPPQ